MKMHFLRRDPMDATFSLTHQLERADRALLHPIRDRCFFDESQQLTHVPTPPMRLRGDLELDLLTGEAGSTDVSNGNAHVPYPEPTW